MTHKWDHTHNKALNMHSKLKSHSCKVIDVNQACSKSTTQTKMHKNVQKMSQSCNMVKQTRDGIMNMNTGVTMWMKETRQSSKNKNRTFFFLFYFYFLFLAVISIEKRGNRKLTPLSILSSWDLNSCSLLRMENWR